MAGALGGANFAVARFRPGSLIALAAALSLSVRLPSPLATFFSSSASALRLSNTPALVDRLLRFVSEFLQVHVSSGG
jgi:hypothetical protein